MEIGNASSLQFAYLPTNLIELCCVRTRSFTGLHSPIRYPMTHCGYVHNIVHS